MFEQSSQQQLLRLAHFSIERALQNQTTKDFPEIINSELEQPLACFVTLKIDNNLRGCIGNMEPHSSLSDTVLRNAYSAAFSDPRFEPLKIEEFERIKISISVLNKPKSLEFEDEFDLLNKLRVNIDGLVIESGSKRATFLPAVWENLPDSKKFLQQLKLKAGMNLDECPERAFIYQAFSISE